MKLITKRAIITLIIAAIALVMGSCRATQVCGSSKMVGYGTPTWKVIKNNR
jgi:hypothetical protein